MTTHTTITIAGQTHTVTNYTNRPMPPLPTLADDWQDQADDSAHNGANSCYQYRLGDGLYLYIDCIGGRIDAVSVEAQDMVDHVLDWEWPEDCDGAQWLAAWHLDPMRVLTPADVDWHGPCRVWRSPNYHSGTSNAPMGDYARDEAGEILEFAGRHTAQAYVDAYYTAPSPYDGSPACEVLGHGQVAPDTLIVVQAD